MLPGSARSTLESQFPGRQRQDQGLIDSYGIADEPTLRFPGPGAPTSSTAMSRACRRLRSERAEAIAAGEELAGALWNFLSGVEARASVQ